MEPIIPPGVHPRSPRWQAQQAANPFAAFWYNSEISQNEPQSSGEHPDPSNQVGSSLSGAESSKEREDSGPQPTALDGTEHFGKTDTEEQRVPIELVSLEFECRAGFGGESAQNMTVDGTVKESDGSSKAGADWRETSTLVAPGSADISPGIIPGLTDDVALLCLAKISYTFRRQIAQVCRLWRQVAQSSALYNVRREKAFSEDILCVFFLDQGPAQVPVCENGAFSAARVSEGGSRNSGTEARTPRNRNISAECSKSSGAGPVGRGTSGQQRDLRVQGRVQGGAQSETQRWGADTDGGELSLTIKALPTQLYSQGGGSGPSDWFRLPPLPLGHSGPSDLWDLQILALGSRICVLGGTVRICGTSLIADVRKDIWIFDGLKRVWEKVAVLKERGKKLVAACDPVSGKIFIASSDEPQVARAPPLMQIFDSQIGDWDLNPVAEMPPSEMRRYLHGASSRAGKFYVFLIDPDSGLQWAECYDPQKRSWAMVDGMPTRKAVVAVEDEFLSIENDPIDRSQGRVLGIERYNRELNSWQRIRDLTPADGRRARARTSVADCFLVGMPGSPGEQGKLCVIGSWQEQSLVGRRWEHKASVSFVSVDSDGSKAPDATGALPQEESVGSGILDADVHGRAGSLGGHMDGQQGYSGQGFRAPTGEHGNPGVGRADFQESDGARLQDAMPSSEALGLSHNERKNENGNRVGRRIDSSDQQEGNLWGLRGGNNGTKISGNGGNGTVHVRIRADGKVCVGGAVLTV